MPNDQENIPLITPIAPITPKKSFAWKTFLTGCLLGGCLPLLTLFILITFVGARTASVLMKDFNVSPTTLTSPTLPLTAVVCGTDPACMQTSVKTCTPAVSTIDSPQFAMSFKVLGPSTKTLGNCQISFEISDVKEANLKMLGLAGQNMVCDVKPSALASTGDILNAPDSDLNCDGTLWGLLKIVRAGQGAK